MRIKSITEKLAVSGHDLTAVPPQQWPEEKADKEALTAAIQQTNKECGSGGREFEPLYKKALELI